MVLQTSSHECKNSKELVSILLVYKKIMNLVWNSWNMLYANYKRIITKGKKQTQKG